MVLNAILLAAAGFIAWLVSTVSAGGGCLLLIPVISFLIGSQAVPPVVTITTLFGGPSRVYLFCKHIRWEIVAWYLPGAVAGAFVGAYIYGAIKEEMIGTKSVNSLAMQLTKIGTYTDFGAMSTELFWYGVSVGLAAALASWAGKLALQRMQGEWFRQIVVAVMVISGLLMLWEQRALFGL